MNVKNETLHYFNLALGQISIEEICINKELIKCVEKIRKLFQEEE